VQRVDLVQQIKAARRVSTPLIAVTTPDPAATVDMICDGLNGSPKITWDVINGFRSRGEAGQVQVIKLVSDFDPSIGNPDEALKMAARLDEQSVLFIHMASRWLDNPMVIQAMWLLRDQFKINRRTLILLSPAIELPAELAGDVVVFDEPLPDGAALERIVLQQFSDSGLSPQAGVVDRAVEAVQGLPAFQAEQVVAMSLTKSGLDVDALWERKRRQIELTPGLKVARGTETFGDIGGVAVVKDFLGKILHGQARPNAVVFVDEIEKMLGGASGGGDTSGVSQDQLGALLSYMQDQAAAGLIFIGPCGSAKSMVAKAAGNEAGIPTIQLDMGGLKGSLVGQSEHQLRSALKVITSVSNGRSLWIATCNSIRDLPPELRRRFTLGTFFFDLPDEGERAAIWEIHREAYGLIDEHLDANPQDDGWTGAEIRQCCDIAWRLGISIQDAAQFVVPVSRSAADQVEALRKGANGRFLWASYPGVYRYDPHDIQTTNRPRRTRRAVTMAEEE
jgi:hypothetical protein